MVGEFVLSSTRVRKVQQVVWLEQPLMARIMQMAAELNVAPNTIIAEMVKRYLERNPEPIRTVAVEKEVKVVKVVCPVCLKEFSDAQSVREHIASSEACWKELEVARK